MSAHIRWIWTACPGSEGIRKDEKFDCYLNLGSQINAFSLKTDEQLPPCLFSPESPTTVRDIFFPFTSAGGSRFWFKLECNSSGRQHKAPYFWGWISCQAPSRWLSESSLLPLFLAHPQAEGLKEAMDVSIKWVSPSNWRTKYLETVIFFFYKPGLSTASKGPITQVHSGFFFPPYKSFKKQLYLSLMSQPSLRTYPKQLAKGSQTCKGPEEWFSIVEVGSLVPSPHLRWL